MVAALGAVVIAFGIMFQVIQIVLAIKNREKNKELTGDAWGGRTLEWSIPSPAPFYNFAITPTVDSRDSFWKEKEERLRDGKPPEKPRYADIHMPKNTATGFMIAMFSGLFGFAMVWHIMWLVAAGFLGVIVTLVMRSLNFDTDYYVKAEEVERIETEYAERAKRSTSVDDVGEVDPGSLSGAT